MLHIYYIFRIFFYGSLDNAPSKLAALMIALRVRARAAAWIERSTLQLGFLRKAALIKEQPARFIFVCSGNICRSPYAEAVARSRGLHAISCGTKTDPGRTADPTAVSQAAERGVNLKAHKTARWHDIDIRGADVIVAMQLKHAVNVLPRARLHGRPVILFSSLLVPKFAVIHDPYGKSAEEFQAVFSLIDIGITRLLELRD